MHLDLTDEQAELLLAELDRIIENDRYPYRPARRNSISGIVAGSFSRANNERRGGVARHNETPPLTTIVLDHDNG